MEKSMDHFVIFGHFKKNYGKLSLLFRQLNPLWNWGGSSEYITLWDMCKRAWICGRMRKTKNKESRMGHHVENFARACKTEVDWQFLHCMVWEDYVLECLCDMLLEQGIGLELIHQFDVDKYHVYWNPTVMKNLNS